MPRRYKTVAGILALGFAMTCFATYMANRPAPGYLNRDGVRRYGGR